MKLINRIYMRFIRLNITYCMRCMIRHFLKHKIENILLVILQYLYCVQEQTIGHQSMEELLRKVIAFKE